MKKSRLTASQIMDAFRTVNAEQVMPLNAGAAIRAAELAGGNRPSVDLMISANALKFSYPFATRNVSNFNFSGLAVVDPAA
jgi:predicted nucleic acid-binding protein